MSHVSITSNSHPKHTYFIQSKYLIHVNFIFNRFCRAFTMSQEEPLKLGAKEIEHVGTVAPVTRGSNAEG